MKDVLGSNSVRCQAKNTMQASRSARVLVADGDSEFRTRVCTTLTSSGHDCSVAASGMEAIQRCVESRFDCALLGAALGDTTGMAIAQRLAGKTDARPTRIILLTNEPKSEFLGALRNGLIDGYVQKSNDLTGIVDLVARSVH